jgi:hypothetical protein
MIGLKISKPNQNVNTKNTDNFLFTTEMDTMKAGIIGEYVFSGTFGIGNHSHNISHNYGNAPAMVFAKFPLSVSEALGYRYVECPFPYGTEPPIFFDYKIHHNAIELIVQVGDDTYNHLYFPLTIKYYVFPNQITVK